MIISTAKEKITEKLTEASAALKNKGLLTTIRAYFTDANFIESADITEKSRIMFGELAVSANGLDEDERVIFVICAELAAGEVSDEELDASIKEFEAEIDEFKKELESAATYKDAIEKINEKQQEEAETAAREMMEELRVAKKKLFWGIGAIVALIAGIVIAGSLL